MKRPVVRVQEVPISILKMEKLVNLTLDAAFSSNGLDIHFCNGYTLGLANKDRILKSILIDSGLNIADGQPLRWLYGSQGINDITRGVDFLRETIKAGLAFQLNHCFIGNLNENFETTIKQQFQGVKITRLIRPPFTGEVSEHLNYIEPHLQSISRDTIVWIGLGTPKQDFIVQQLSIMFPNLVFVAIGAAIDFIQNPNLESPEMMRRLGLEWFYRLCKEPKRLWRRYFLVTAPFYIALLLHRLIGLKLSKNKV